MRLKEFQDLLDRYGGDLFEWPPAQRADAFALLKSSVEAQRLLEETRQMETFLAEDVFVPEPNPDAIDQVMARIQEHESRTARETVSAGYPDAATAPRRSIPSFLKETIRELGGFIYRPALLFATFSLMGVLVGVAEKMAAGDSLQGVLLLFVMNL